MPSLRICPACHKKTLSPIGFSLRMTSWRCPCGFNDERPARQVDKKHLERLFHPSPAQDMHALWHAFEAHFYKKSPSHGAPVWKWIGYPLMQRIEKWAKTHKIHITSCDDGDFCSSMIVMIPHQNKMGDYHGTTALIVTQSGEAPTAFFLYPSHHDSMLALLTTIKKRATTSARGQRAWKGS